MGEWIAARVLPNVELREPIEGGLAALVPHDDPRVEKLCKAHLHLREFLDRFTDAFGEELRPAVLIVQKDAPRSILTVEALASFRDVIAISVVGYNRALELRHPRGHRITFSSSFWFYPWMLDIDNEYLVIGTPAMLGMHDITAFKGQSSPEIWPMVLRTPDIDHPLMNALLARWQSHFARRGGPEWPDLALFRSLNMANQAALPPAGSDTTFYDVGRSIALWVSAFEILAHPGIGKSGLFPVYELLDKVEWKLRSAAARRYKAYEPGRNPTHRRTLACWLYGELYDVRNHFLHGNPVSRNRLNIKRADRNLFQYTAPLYRMALTGFLSLSWPASVPSTDDPKAIGQHISARIDFLGYQETIEKGLLTARGNGPTPPMRSRRSPC